MPRWQFAYSLSHKELKGTTIDLEGILDGLSDASPKTILDRVCNLLLGGPLEAEQCQALLATLNNPKIDQPALAAALTATLMASPNFQWY